MYVNRIYFRMRKTFRVLLGIVVFTSMQTSHAQKPVSQQRIQEFQTDFDGAFQTPDWAKGLVWYQVFPERFRNGNSDNDPSGFDQALIEWEADWPRVSIEEIERGWNRGRISPDLFGIAQTHTHGGLRGLVYARRYGGDLQGVYEQLESIKAQGFGGVYLCPVFQSRSLHKYDASDHRHIDPTLGDPGVYVDPGPGHVVMGEDENPFDETTWAWTSSDRWFVDVFLPKAKSLGLRVMLDGVWNHVGLDHFAFQDVRRQGSASRFADWFDVVFDDDGALIGWQGWSRVNGGLPEFRHVGDDIAPGPKAHIMAVTRRWMDPNGDGDPSDGINGWRLDVAGEIGTGFWGDWRQLVKQINPEALIVAEIWGDAGELLSDRAFDAQMNYPFAYPVADWLSLGDEGVRDNAKVVASRLERVFHHGREIDCVQLNLMTSHDTERLVSMMHNRWGRGFDNESSRWFGRYESDAVDKAAMQRAMAAIAVMVASPGGMMIYNGDEYAIAGADDPDNRRPIPTEINEPEILDFNEGVQRLIAWRNDPVIGEVFRLGDARFESVGDHSLVVERAWKDQLVRVSIAPQRVMLEPSELRVPGWVRDHETERKCTAGLDSWAVSMAVYRRESDERDVRESP
jgi:cyclomaltodextrinase